MEARNGTNVYEPRRDALTPREWYGYEHRASTSTQSPNYAHRNATVVHADRATPVRHPDADAFFPAAIDDSLGSQARFPSEFFIAPAPPAEHQYYATAAAADDRDGGARHSLPPPDERRRARSAHERDRPSSTMGASAGEERAVAAASARPLSAPFGRGDGWPPFDDDRLRRAVSVSALPDRRPARRKLKQIKSQQYRNAGT